MPWPKGRRQNAEERAKNSAARKGKTFTPEHRANISAVQKGRTFSPQHRAKISAALKDKQRRRSDDISYSAAHARLRRVMRRPCEECGTSKGRLEVALRKGNDLPGLRCSINPRCSFGMKYSTDPEAYIVLCSSCHRFFDKVVDRWVETPLDRSRRFARN